MYSLYSFFYSIYVIWSLPFFLFNAEKRNSICERFGFIKKSKIDSLKESNPIWIHAVSVGEVRLALQLIDYIKAEISDMTIIMTVTTISGRQIAQSASAGSMQLFYSPLDFAWVVKKFLISIKPRLLIIMETELWPNLLMQVKSKGVESIIVNGRISNKAWSKYSRIKPLMKRVLRPLSLCLAQSQNDARRFMALGLDASKVKVAGNIKYDTVKPEINEQVNIALKKFGGSAQGKDKAKMVVCASTHHDEEEQIVQAWINRSDELGTAKLLIAPRHIHRCGAVSNMLQRYEIKCVLYSQITQGLELNLISDAKVLILDEWGLLNQIYGFADIIYIGGSLVAWGGHNLAEAAIWRKPLLHGPHMHNFEDMKEVFLENQASCKVMHSSGFIDEVINLLSNQQRSDTLAKNAEDTVTSNSGAASSCLEEIKKCLYD
ncbi:MAG: 3-deoxy-D-manno-octulosonic-acid transferase [Candidatus Omnitrophota bacterium]|jgi:3-deoxy-D-manno-octulosonic-acid transferase